MALKAPTSPDLAARALSHVTETREAARERIQRENAELFVWRQTYMDRFDATSEYLLCAATGREWGEPAEKRLGGRGIAVQASASCKPGKSLKGTK